MQGDRGPPTRRPAPMLGSGDVLAVVLAKAGLGHADDRAGEVGDPAVVEVTGLIAAEGQVVAEQCASDVVTTVAVEASVRDKEGAVEPRVVAALPGEVAVLDHD